MTSFLHEPGNARLRVATADDGHATVIIIDGEADRTNLDEFATALAAIELDGRRSVRIDVSRLSFFDVAGLRRLTALAAQLRERGLDVTTSGAQPMLHEAARILGVDDELGLT